MIASLQVAASQIIKSAPHLRRPISVLYSPHMASKKPIKKTAPTATLANILSTVKRGLATLEGTMERNFAAVAEDIADIKSTMATKDEVRAIVREELAPIHAETPGDPL